MKDASGDCNTRPRGGAGPARHRPGESATRYRPPPGEAAAHNLLGDILVARGRARQTAAAYPGAARPAPVGPAYRLNPAHAHRLLKDAAAAAREAEG